MGHLRRSLLTLLVLACAAPASAGAQAFLQPLPGNLQQGYVPLPDGTQLKYTALLPDGKGPFPVLLQYEGYSGGSDPTRANDTFVPTMLKKGYAVVGVNLRGAGCSTGTWDLFNKQQAKDGAFAVDWIAERPWANGKVGMYSYSYAGIMQLWTAAERPKHLVAATPANVVADTYRDIGFPGGIYNTVFPPEWGASLNADWQLANQRSTREGDAQCAAHAAANIAANNANQLAVQAPQHPFDDSWHRNHSGVNWAKDIDVPIYVVRNWQDEETGSRQADWFEQTDPEKTWLVTGPGNHLIYQKSSVMLKQLEAFYDHYLKGIDNGWERTPRVQVWHETGLDSNPRSVTTFDRLPVPVQEADLYLRSGGTIGDAPEDRAATQSYRYPLPAPVVTDTAGQGLQQSAPGNTWTASTDLVAGRAAFTTPPLANTVTTYGPLSADLWISTTAPDVDVQTTITEVRPDGQELYLQRGWLRASHRALDPARSTPFSPWHPHTAAAQKDMPAGTPQLLRVDVMPLGHTFRKGSSLRVYVEQPSVTGLWGFQALTTPQTVTVHTGKDTPSRLVLGVLPRADVKPDRPGCDAQLNIGCRPNPVAVPSGSLTVTPKAAPPTAAATGSGLVARFSGRRSAARGGVVVKVRATGRTRSGVTVELRRGTRTVARIGGLRLGSTARTLVLRRPGRARFADGAYTLVVRARSGAVLLRRAVRLKG